VTSSAWRFAPVALALLGCTRGPPAEVTAEVARREAYAHAIAVDAGQGSAWSVSSRSEILFEEGFSGVQYDPPDDFRAHGFRWTGQRARVRLKSHGDRPMHLLLYGWVNLKVTRTHPTLAVYVDGQLVGGAPPVDDSGLWGIDTIVPASMLRDAKWVDLTLVVSAVAWHWAEPPDLRVVVLNGLFWDEPR